MARIAMASNVGRLLGDFADEVENRSLLLDKFIFHKRWNDRPVPGFPEKWDDAVRWSFMRLSDDGLVRLKQETAKLREDASRSRDERKRQDLLARAAITERMSKVAAPSPEVAELRARHTRRFLSLFQGAQQNRGTVLIGKLEGRLAINLADGLVQNANICLDRLLGVPYIPGSAVKGVTRHTALEELKAATGTERARLFDLVLRIFGAATNDFAPAKPAQGHRAGIPAGSLHAHLDLLPPAPKERNLLDRAIDQKGAIAFLPAWPVNTAKIVVDLTNVHTPLYYSGKKERGEYVIRPGEVASLAEEKPTITAFPAVETGAQFAFAFVLNGMSDEPALLQQATQWLRTALTVRGIGAKTAAGYGWFSIDDAAVKALADAAQADEAKAKQEAQARAAAEAKRLEDEARAKAEADRLASLGPVEREMESLLMLSDEQFATLVKNLAAAPEQQQHAVIRLLREHKVKRDRWKAWRRHEKKDILASVQDAITRLGLPPLP